jgi:amino acid adenylation domain-containing protein
MPPSGDLGTIERLSEQTISECFDRAVRCFGDQPALFEQNRILTFNDLNSFVNQAAHAIQQRTGLGRHPVILLIDQRASAIVGFLAILKAGKICVPANPVNNEARFLNTIIAETKPSLVISCSDLLEIFQTLGTGLDVLDLDRVDGKSAALRSPPRSEDASIVVYTSGSTGMPKGVLHHERNILHRVFWYASQFNIGQADRTMMLSAPDHISGTVGMLRALLTGGQLHMWSIRRRGLDALAYSINEHGITILPIVNSVFRRLTDEITPDFQWPSLRMVIIGGEPAYLDDVRRFRRHCPPGSMLINTLGCTELPTYRYFVIHHDTELPNGSVPAGYAVAGTKAMIVSESGTEAPTGQTGEIVVSSRYLAMGYWNRPEETAKKFTFAADGTRLFRTGDLGTIRGDGILEHIGRQDWLVKILGNRVELGEIEATLRLHEGVRDACVVAQSDNQIDTKLYAYVVTREHPRPAPSDLQSFLRAHLPDYMIPSRFEFLPSLPLNRSGKLDRRALETRALTPCLAGVVHEPPRTDTERRIAEICMTVLGLDSIGVDENLFDLGANSLLATMIVSRLMVSFGVELPLTLVFDLPTVSELATLLSSSAQT